MTQVAIFQIVDTFLITERGLILVGPVLEGTVSLNDYVEFTAFGKVFKRKVTGIELGRPLQEGIPNTGLLIECVDKLEMEELRDWNPEKVKSVVWSGEKVL